MVYTTNDQNMVGTASHPYQGVPHGVPYPWDLSCNITTKLPSNAREDVQNTTICLVKSKTTNIKTRTGIFGGKRADRKTCARVQLNKQV